MNSEKTDIIIIKGAPGSGKTQTAKCLAGFFPKGIRMEIDNLRSMVISVDWTNQTEHINLLHLSTKVVCDFIQLGFRPVIVVDTFSGDKVLKYLDDLYQLDKDQSISVFGLFTAEEELKNRIESRSKEEFKDLNVCNQINEDTQKTKYDIEFQIDTTGLMPIETANLIFNQLNKQ
jgi:hypothetical protein